jgi:hypothetical protein
LQAFDVPGIISLRGQSGLNANQALFYTPESSPQWLH